MDIDRETLLREFEAEAEEQLDTMAEALVALESSAEWQEILRGICRAAHTFKGNAACLGFETLAELSHGLEDVLEGLWQERLSPSRELVSDALAVVDLVRELLPRALEGESCGSSPSGAPRRCAVRAREGAHD